MVTRRVGDVRFATIIARNYLPYARVLAASLARWHPRARLTCCVIDDRERAMGATVDGDGASAIDVVHVADLVREPSELERMATCYDVMELATAVKPWVLRHLLEEGAAVAVHLDPDIECFAPLDDLAQGAQAVGIALTPHTTEPIPRDGRKPSEADLMETGTYNLGFVAVSAAAMPFLDWWQVRLRRDAIVDPTRMLFTDQRWVDLAPGYFPVHVVRDPGCNVAYWNLGTRALAHTGAGWTVNGARLRFLHYSGYDPDRPHLLSRHQGERPRVLLSERPELRQLCDAYRARLLLAGWGDPDLPAYGYGRVPGGPPLDRLMRRGYRRALLASEEGGRPEPPNPFRPGEAAAFTAWLREPVGGPGSRLTRYLDFLYHDRIDLQVAFNDVPGAGTEWFLTWAREHGVSEEGLPVDLVPEPLEAADDPDGSPGRVRPLPRLPRRAAGDAVAMWEAFAPAVAVSSPRGGRRRPPLDVGGAAGPAPDPGETPGAETPAPPEAPADSAQTTEPSVGPAPAAPANAAPAAPDAVDAGAAVAPARRPPGVNVAGYLEAELGLGTAARVVLRAIELTGSPVATLVYRDTQSRQSRPFAPLVEGEAPYDVSLICINGDLIGNFARDAGADVFRDRYTIAQWHWETDTFPDSMRAGLDLVDEVWVASRYEQAAIQRETDKPVVVFPMPVVQDEAVPALDLPREALGLPEGFCFFFCFDYLSVMERKNPLGLVEAFARAFPPGSGVHLVVKSINGERRPNERERLRLAAQAHPDVHLLETYLSGAEVQALTSACDAYVSLHRAEGFGLTLADAMAHGRPVIATRYSGNLEFMDDDTGYLVDFQLVPVGDAGAPYPRAHRWADPDLDHAARLMREVVADPAAARARAARGQAALRAGFSTAACAAFASQRLAAIRAARDAAAPPRRPGWLALDGGGAPGGATAAEVKPIAPTEAAGREPESAADGAGETVVPSGDPAAVPAAPAPFAAGWGAEAPPPPFDDSADPAARSAAAAPPPPAPAVEVAGQPQSPVPAGAVDEATPVREPPPVSEPAAAEGPPEAHDAPAAPEAAEAPQPTPVPPLPVTDAAERLIGGGMASPDGGRGGPGGAVRHTVDRVMLPYERHQRQVAQALLSSIREVAGTVPAATDLVHRRVDGAEARRAELGARVEGLTGHVDRLTSHVQGLDRLLDGLRTHLQGLDGHVQGLVAHVQALDAHVQGLTPHVQGLDTHVRGLDSHVEGLEDRLGGLGTTVATIGTHLDRVTRHLQGLTELVDGLNGRTDQVDARQGRILVRHDRLQSRVDRMEDLVTHLERIERELLRARRAAERVVARAQLDTGAPGAGDGGG